MPYDCSTIAVRSNMYEIRTNAVRKPYERHAKAMRMPYEVRAIAAREQEEDGDSDDEEDDVDPLGSIHFKASAQVAKWQKNWMRRVKALRSAERKTLYGFFTTMQRSAGEITQSFLVKHETFRRVLSRTIARTIACTIACTTARTISRTIARTTARTAAQGFLVKHETFRRDAQMMVIIMTAI